MAHEKTIREGIKDAFDFRVFDSVGKLRALRPGFITLSTVTHGQFSSVHSNIPCIIRVSSSLLCVYTYMYEERERLDGGQGLTADGLGAPFARAQPRLGKHPRSILSTRELSVCAYTHTPEKEIYMKRV